MTDRRLLKQIIVIVILSCGCLAAQTRNPERKVEGNAIVSESDPKVRIELPKSVQYVGAGRWVLYGIADCELHAFVEADERKNVQRLYWVQFEGYIPTKPKLKHQYDSPSTRRSVTWISMWIHGFERTALRRDRDQTSNISRR